VSFRHNIRGPFPLALVLKPRSPPGPTSDTREFAALVLPGVANGILKANGAEEPVDQQTVFLNPVLQETVRQFHREGKLVAAICSATVVLAAAGILKARRFTSPMGDNELFKGAIRVRQPAVRDANIITGVGARPYHFCDLLVEARAGEEAASGYREHVGIHRQLRHWTGWVWPASAEGLQTLARALS